jgi:HD-GYP domain-containing protein (c-di-GMP phosphodiesterase class II)
MTAVLSQKIVNIQDGTSDVQLLLEMEAVVAWSLQDESINDFHPTISPHDDQAIFFEKSGFRQLYIGPQIYRNQSSLAHYIESECSKPHTTLVCVGREEDLSNLPLECLQHNFQQVGLPATTATLRACVRTTYNFQITLANSRAEKDNLEETTENVKTVMSISRELNGERDIPKLLMLILLKAREITKADAGSIYTVEYPQLSSKLEDASLRFRFTQNFSKHTDFSEFSVPIDNKSIVGNAVLHQTSINIPDLYTLNNDPTTNPYQVKHNRSFDQRLGYESHSMLSLPMFDISHRVIGVIQLINRKRDFKASLTTPEDFQKQVIAFSEHDEEYAEIVAQQAGIALENAELQNEIQHLFNGFVNASVTAIEQRDPTTSGHSHRVAALTGELAKVVDKTTTGPFKDICFNEFQFKEIEYASLLHDFGKLGVRENVLVKAKKLYPWQHESVHERFELIKACLEIEYLKQMVNFMSNPMAFPADFSTDAIKLERDRKFHELDQYLKFIFQANEPTVLPQGGFEKLNDIAILNFIDVSGNKKAFLKSEELKALSVSRGSLTAEEFGEIQSHVTHTYEFLRQIPWGHRLTNVPEIAAKHHEKLDGSGYPTAASGSQIPIQSRMMTIADIFDALTAADRPYKKSVPAEKALDIIGMEVKGGKIDPHLYELFIESGAFKVTHDRLKAL